MGVCISKNAVLTATEVNSHTQTDIQTVPSRVDESTFPNNPSSIMIRNHEESKSNDGVPTGFIPSTEVTEAVLDQSLSLKLEEIGRREALVIEKEKQIQLKELEFEKLFASAPRQELHQLIPHADSDQVTRMDICEEDFSSRPQEKSGLYPIVL